jgi:hypothetical protein
MDNIKVLRALHRVIGENERIRVATKRPDIVNYIAKKLPFSYRIQSAPIQILDYDHPLDDKSENLKMLEKLNKDDYLVLHDSAEGQLRFYQQVIALVDDADREKPIKFLYVFFPTTLDGKEALQNFYMWRDKSINTKIEGLSLRNYCVFNVLLPEVHIIISADQHTEAGENASKSLLKEALGRKLFVYYTTEKGKLKRFFSLDELGLNFWGATTHHGKRLTVISDHELEE